jgi:hypothetical protein
MVSSKIAVGCTDGLQNRTMHWKANAQDVKELRFCSHRQQGFVDKMEGVAMLVNCLLVQIVNFRNK